VKSRTLAQKLVESGAVRLNSVRCKQPDARIGAGDVLTITIGKRLLVWKVLAPGDRRGPASEAQGLYEDLSPELPPRSA
jgi:ribosome-associated heat shock protein Hsp15